MSAIFDYLTQEPVWFYVRLVLFLVGTLAFVGANAAYLVWVERKGAGRFQRRPGPTEVGWAGLLQPVADGIKLLAKQLIVPPGADAAPCRGPPRVPRLLGSCQSRSLRFSVLDGLVPVLPQLSQ